MLDDSYNGDRFIKSAIDKSLTRLNDIIAIKRPFWAFYYTKEWTNTLQCGR